MFCRPGANPGTIHVFAPAKLNLTLEVGPPRHDGYHPLASVMVPISLADEIVLTARDDSVIDLEVVMDDPLGVTVEATEDNLVLRAARLMQAYIADRSAESLGVSIRLEKRIPVAAGLAGGSADAAAVLVGLNKLWGIDLSETTLARLGMQLGADVPFCIRSRAGLVEGIGDHYTPLAGVPKLPLVLLNPRRPLSTAQVFEKFDSINTEPNLPGERTVQMVRTLYIGELRNIAKALYNDLEYPAQLLLPEVGRMQDALMQAGAIGTLVTGSGPTVFAMANDAAHAAELVHKLRHEHAHDTEDWWMWSGWGGTIEETDLHIPLTEASAAEERR